MLDTLIATPAIIHDTVSIVVHDTVTQYVLKESKNSFEQGVDIAQLVTALVTTVGVLASVLFSRRTIKEMQKDRQHQSRPNLVITTPRIKLELALISKLSPRLVVDALQEERIQISNLGRGPAFGPILHWRVNVVRYRDSRYSRVRRTNKRFEGIYAGKEAIKHLDELSSSTFIVDKICQPGQATELVEDLPGFISRDIALKIMSVEGVTILEYYDEFGNMYRTEREFTIMMKNESRSIDDTCCVIWFGERAFQEETNYG